MTRRCRRFSLWLCVSQSYEESFGLDIGTEGHGTSGVPKNSAVDGGSAALCLTLRCYVACSCVGVAGVIRWLHVLFRCRAEVNASLRAAPKDRRLAY